MENVLLSDSLKKESENKVAKNLSDMMNLFVSQLNHCQNEYDYFGLMIAVGIFYKSVNEKFQQDLLKDISSINEMENYFATKENCVNALYKELVKVN